MNRVDVERLREIAEIEFADIVVETYVPDVNELRIILTEGSFIIVTDRFHTRRAARTFRTRLPKVTIRVSAAPDPRYDPARWWQTEDGLVAVFSEALKLGFYWLKYGITPL